MSNEYVTSTKPGYEWKVYVYRQSNGVIAAIAVEGQVSDDGKMFTTAMFEDRQERIPLDAKRLTEKVRLAGIEAIKAHLKAKGFID